MLDILNGKEENLCSYAQKNKIKKLQNALGWSDSQLFWFIKRQTGMLTFSLDFISKEHATKVIIGLIKVSEYGN